MMKCLSKGVGRTGSWTIQILEILMWIYVLIKYFPNTIKKHSKPASMQKKRHDQMSIFIAGQYRNWERGKVSVIPH